MTKKMPKLIWIGFFLTSAMIVIIVFLMAKDKTAMRPMMFVGIGLALASLIMRSITFYAV
jgi:hypothetical protein